jgi:glucokinase
MKKIFCLFFCFCLFNKINGFDMPEFKETFYEENIENGELVLASDIGGTNSRFAVFQIQENKPILVRSLLFRSDEINNFAELINEVLKFVREKYGYQIEKASFAVAGAISANRDFVHITNVNLDFDVADIIAKTGLKSIKLVNDFEAVGYGIQILDEQSVFQINKGSKDIVTRHKPKVAIGAGTGLGKAILVWNRATQQYSVVSSEGGHADFVAQNQNELELVNFVKSELNLKDENVEWEDLLSGSGISLIYKFLQSIGKYEQTKYSIKIKESNYSSVLISKYKTQDKLCKDAFDLFARFYARVAKNLALEVLALDGVYIVGKIATENIEIFDEENFFDEFFNCRKLRNVLEQIPVFIVTDFNVGLYGAAVFAAL